jgi:hypothetical protein
VGGHLPPIGLGQREAIEQVIRDRTRVVEVPQPGHQHQVLPPGEDLVHGSELPGQAEGFADLPGLRGDIEAVYGHRTRVRVEQRGEDFHEGRLARPFEPSRAKMLPRATSKSTPRSTSRSLKVLLHALDVDRRPLNLTACHLAIPLAVVTAGRLWRG